MIRCAPWLSLVCLLTAEAAVAQEPPPVTLPTLQSVAPPPGLQAESPVLPAATEVAPLPAPSDFFRQPQPELFRWHVLSSEFGLLQATATPRFRFDVPREDLH